MAELYFRGLVGWGGDNCFLFRGVSASIAYFVSLQHEAEERITSVDGRVKIKCFTTCDEIHSLLT
jgi:hypothetical protein